MIEIQSSQVTPQFTQLFNLGTPTAVRCFSVLAGGNAGRIFVDDLEHPNMGYVWERDDGTLYRGGAFDPRVQQEMVDLLREGGIVAIGFWEGETIDHLPPNPDAGAECVDLFRPALGSELAPFLHLPEGYEIQRVTQELCLACGREEETLFRYGNMNTFLQHAIELFILHEGKFMARAGVDMEVNGTREIGVFTEKEYWGRGLGTIAVAHLLRICDEMGCNTCWDCVRLNIRSLKIARRLSYKNEKSYKLLAWFPPGRKIGINE